MFTFSHMHCYLRWLQETKNIYHCQWASDVVETNCYMSIQNVRPSVYKKNRYMFYQKRLNSDLVGLKFLPKILVFQGTYGCFYMRSTKTKSFRNSKLDLLLGIQLLSSDFHQQSTILLFILTRITLMNPSVSNAQ